MSDPSDRRDREYVPYPYLGWFEASRRVPIAKEASMNQGRRKSVFIGALSSNLTLETTAIRFSDSTQKMNLTRWPRDGVVVRESLRRW